MSVQPLHTDEIVLHYRGLKHDLETAEGEQKFWAELLEQEPFKELLKDYETTIQGCRVALEDAKSEDVKKYQADIRSRKDLICKLHENAAMSKVISARRKVADFRDKNSLLLAEEA